MKISTVSARTAHGHVRQGQVYEDDHPAVKDHPEMFADPDDYAEQQMPRELQVGAGDRFARPVEEASAAPGQKRASTRKKAAVEDEN